MKKLLVGVGVCIGVYATANTAVKTVATTASISTLGHNALDKASAAAKFVLVPVRLPR